MKKQQHALISQIIVESEQRLSDHWKNIEDRILDRLDTLLKEIKDMRRIDRMAINHLYDKHTKQSQIHKDCLFCLKKRGVTA